MLAGTLSLCAVPDTYAVVNFSYFRVERRLEIRASAAILGSLDVVRGMLSMDHATCGLFTHSSYDLKPLR